MMKKTKGDFCFELSLLSERFTKNRYFNYWISERGKVVSYGICCTETLSDEKTMLDHMMKNLISNSTVYARLPKVSLLPEPLRTIARDYWDTDECMLYYGHDEDFPFSDEQLTLLEEQIERYGLNSIIDITPDVSEGEAVITVYWDLGLRFNFC